MNLYESIKLESNKNVKVPEYAKECIGNDLYDDHFLDLRSSEFIGDTLIVEPRETLSKELFDKIVDRINYYFNSYGVVADSFEDQDNKVCAIDCTMTPEGYETYLANSDEDSTITIEGRSFKDKSDAKDWLNEQLAEYGNTYFFPDQVKATLNRLTEHFGNTYFW